MQIVLVYFQPFRCNLVLKYALHLKMAKKLLKILFWKVQVV